MKNVWMAALVVAVVMMLRGVAYAERVVSIDEARTFTLAETKVLLKVPDVPKGVSAEQAQALIEGTLSSVKVEDQAGKVTDSFAFPWVWAQITYQDRLVFYRDGKWVPQDLPTKSLPAYYQGMKATVFLVLFPLICIAAISLCGSFLGGKLITLLLFYLALFASVAGGMQNPAIGVFGGGLFCGVMSIFCSDRLKHLFAGMGTIAGAVVGLAPGIFEGSSLQPYVMFLLAVMANSFILAWGATVLMQARQQRLLPPELGGPNDCADDEGWV